MEYTAENPTHWYLSRLRESANKTFTIGNMYLFKYDPKWKHKLPYYDTLPLVIVLSVTKKGFLGLNLHYLDPKLRLLFFNELLKFAPSQEPNTIIRDLAISYIKVKNTTNLYKPCIKQYLFNHVGSKFIAIEEDKWFSIPYVPENLFNSIVILPIEQFVKQSKEHVWHDSIRIISR